MSLYIVKAKFPFAKATAQTEMRRTKANLHVDTIAYVAQMRWCALK